MNQLVLTCFFLATSLISVSSLSSGKAFGQLSKTEFGPYLYEAKLDGEDFATFNPRLAPPPGDLLLRAGDRLAICGDSITEQKMYSRIIESYLTVCEPELDIAVRQLGWSGEKTDGFLRRMERDCLTFEPTVATLAYGMNDSRYRPFDVNNGRWYEDHYSAIVAQFKSKGVRVVVGSPGCAGKLATWVNSRQGTLREHNLHLCALRDIALGVAEQQQVAFADIFWPMYQAQFTAPKLHPSSSNQPYEVAGGDGIHPGWAGHTMMAYAFLRSLGLKGDIGQIEINLTGKTATASNGHTVQAIVQATDAMIEVSLVSTRYPFCAEGDIHSDQSVRSGMTLVPFNQELNRLTLRVKTSSPGRYRVTWGDGFQDFSSDQLNEGINLAESFPANPFLPAFRRVDEAVAKKQAYETEQIKREFHSKAARENFPAVIAQTESQRQPLVDAITAAFQPVEHRLQVHQLVD